MVCQWECGRKVMAGVGYSYNQGCVGGKSQGEVRGRVVSQAQIHRQCTFPLNILPCTYAFDDHMSL